MLRFLVPLLLSAGLAQAQTTVRPLLTLGNSASDPSTRAWMAVGITTPPVM